MLACEICDKAPAQDAGVWTLCSECTNLYEMFLNLVKKHDVDAKDLEPLKQSLRLEAREIGLVK